MKLYKKQIGTIVWAMILVLLLMTACGIRKNGDHQGESTQPNPSVEATTATEEATEASEETTEETTEAAEETTEATEETTTTTTGGNTTPGGTSGYVPDSGSDDDDDSSDGTTAETAPAAGSEKSPYVEQIVQIPESFVSVSIPANSTVYHHVYGAEGSVLSIADNEAYVIYNGTTYSPDEYGLVQVPMAKAEASASEETSELTGTEENTETGVDTETESAALVQPQILQIGSKSAEARSFLVSFHPPLGSLENPEQLEAVEGLISFVSALEAGDEDGHYFSYTALCNGQFTVQAESATENVAFDVIVTIGEQVLKLSEWEEGILSVDIFTDDVVLIQILTLPGEDGQYPAADISVSCQVVDTSGTKQNPIDYMGQFPIVTDELEPGAEIYYNVYSAGGMLLTIADPDAYVIMGEETWTAVDGVVAGEVVSTNPRMPAVIGIGNGGETAKSFTVEFQHKLGSMMNPAPLNTEDNNTAVISAGNTNGYWYTWTAQKNGTMTLTMLDSNWMYLINQVTETDAIYGETRYSDDEDVSNLVDVPVSAGDVLNIMVCTYDPENTFEIPAGEVVFAATFTTSVGTQDNPMWMTELEISIPVKPGETFYCNEVFSGVTMEVAGEGAFTVTYNGVNYAPVDGVVTIPNASGTRQQPVPVLLTNYSTEDATYTVRFVYPEGTGANPRILEQMGDYTAAVKGDGEGYFYSWTATADGLFTITMLGDDWTYVMNNLTSYAYGDIHSSAEGAAASETIEVIAGDLIQINIGTASGQDKDVSLNVDFCDPTYGTEENPVWLVELENTLTVKAGATVYANVTMSGVTMTIAGPEEFALIFNSIEYASENGIVTIYGVNGSRFTPLQMILTNSGTEQAEYTVSYAYPVGSRSNPEEIAEMRQYTASVAGDSEGYFYSWTSDLDGVFTVTMLSDDWIYVINNLTTEVSGEFQVSAEGAPASATIEVKTGDVIQVNIGTSSGKNKDVALEFDAYDPTLGTEENPIWLTGLENSVTIRPDTTVYCNVSLSNVTMTITGDNAFAATFDGVSYPVVDGVITVSDVNASRFMPLQLILTNSGDKKTKCAVNFAYPLGSGANPQILTELGEYTPMVVGDGEGYFYTWFAEADGEFTVTMLSDDWIYVMNNLTSYAYGGIHDSQKNGEASETIAVKAGDEIQINIGTSSRKDMEVALKFAFQEAVAEQENLVFEGNYSPKTFTLDVEEEVKQMGLIDLTNRYTLASSKAGIYSLDTTNGPLVLLDFTDDTYVNLKNLVESTAITIQVTAADGSVITQNCNELLKKYMACAWVQEISEEKVRTLYPLTKDLELILKSLGEQLGWFDPDSDGYLFTEEVLIAEAESEEGKPLAQETLWMFACSYVEFFMGEEAEAQETEAALQEPSESPTEIIQEPTEEVAPESVSA